MGEYYRLFGSPVHDPVALRNISIEYGFEKTTIKDVGLSVRTTNCLKSAGAETFAEVLMMSPKQLRAIRNMGSKCVNELRYVAELIFETEITRLRKNK